jgi:hypothetical protein
MLENNGAKLAGIFGCSPCLTFSRRCLSVESVRFFEVQFGFFVFFSEAMVLPSSVRSRISEVSLFSALFSIFRFFSAKTVAHGKTKAKEEKK